MHTRATACVVIAAALTLLGSPPGGAQSARTGLAPQLRPVQLWTEDGVRLTGDFYEPQQGSGAAVVLHHSLGRSRAALTPLAERLARARVHVVNMDLRGHGQSRYRRAATTGGAARGANDTPAFAIPLEESNYAHDTFTRSDWRRLPDDVGLALTFARKQAAVRSGRVALLGASIGANASLLAGARDGARAVVALSPGESYRGLAIAEASDQLRKSAVFVAVAEADTSAARGAELLAAANPDFLVRFANGRAHGEPLLRAVPGLEDEIVAWLLTTLGVQLPPNHPEYVK